SRSRRRGRAPEALPTSAAARRTEHSVCCWLVKYTALLFALSLLGELDLNCVLLSFLGHHFFLCKSRGSDFYARILWLCHFRYCDCKIYAFNDALFNLGWKYARYGLYMLSQIL